MQDLRKQNQHLPFWMGALLYLAAFLGAQTISAFMAFPYGMANASMILDDPSAMMNSDVLVRINGAAQILTFGLPFVLLAWLKPSLRKSLRLTSPSFTQVVLGIVALVTLSISASTLSYYWVSFLKTMGWYVPPASIFPPVDSIDTLVLSLVWVSVVPGICEEFLFRGILMGSMQKYKPYVAILVSGGLFVMMHGSVPALGYHLPLGILLSFVAYTSGSIWVPVVMHFLNNALVCLTEYLLMNDVYGSGMTSAFLNGYYSGDYGPLFWVPIAALVILAIAVVGLYQTRKGRVLTTPVTTESKWGWLPVAGGAVMSFLLYLINTFSSLVDLT